MDKSTYTKTTTIWSCLALVALMALPPVEGLSVCYSHDGYLAFTASPIGGDCFSQEAEPTPDDSCASYCGDSRCNPREDSHCHDFNFDPPEYVHAFQRTDLEGVDLQPATTACPSAHGSSVLQPVFGRKPPPGTNSDPPLADHLALKRVTVLLI